MTTSKGKRRELNRLSRVKPLLFLIAGASLSFAPLWASHIQKIWGRTLFATPDSMVLLGVTLLVSILAAYLLPDLFVSNRTGTSSSCRSRTQAQGLGACLWFIFGLSSVILLAFVLYWINQHILHAFLSSADEHSCYFLAECLRKGKLYVDIPPLSDFFKVVHVGMRGGKWFSVYPPGWPLIWAFGLQYNIVDWLNPVLSALSVFFFFKAGKRLFGRAPTLLGLAFMILNPFFMFTAASYFSHATCLLMISVFLYSFLRWREDYRRGGDPVRWAALCAFAIGYGLMTRYLTMAAIVGPFLLYHYLSIFIDWRGWHKGGLPIMFKWPKLRKCDWVAIGIIAVFMLVILYQNYLVTGKAFRAPNKHDKSWERLGFRKAYTPVDGLFFLIGRVFYLMDWFAPAIVAAYLLLLCNFRGLKKLSTSAADPEKVFLRHLFRLSMLCIAFAYFFYYSWGGNQWGPRYYWEGMPFLCIAVADWIVSLWRDSSLRARKFLLAFVAMSFVTSGMIFVQQAESVEASSRQRKALYVLAEQTIQKPAIVFIHGFLGSRLVLAEEDATRNSPFLDGNLLYVHDLGERNIELMTAYSGREYYRGTYDREQGKAVLLSLENNAVPAS